MLCVLSTDFVTTNLSDVNWTVTVINQRRLPPGLLTPLRITPPAHHHGHKLPWLKHYERILVETVVFEVGWVNLNANFREEWSMERHPPKTVGVRKLESLGNHVALFA